MFGWLSGLFRSNSAEQKVPDTVTIPGPTRDYVKSTSSPFYRNIAKMTAGSYVKYESVDEEWHVFVVEGGPEYGRPAVNDISVVVRRVSTGRVFTMPAARLTACDASFASRDGTPIRRGESWRDQRR